MIILETFFLSIIVLLIWTYIGYLLSLWLVSRFCDTKAIKREFFPQVSLIITAHNEEKMIAGKIENALGLQYPRDKLQIIVVSDGSDDDTEGIVRSYQASDVELLVIAVRHGKHYAQGEGIKMARGEIIVFTDTATLLKEDAIAKIVRPFSDPYVGCVSGEDRAMSEDSGFRGEDLYVRYEMRLRNLESRIGSLVGVSGSFSAARKDLCRPWFSDMSSDFYLPILAFIRGYRSAVGPEAVGYYQTSKIPGEEFQRKVRTVVHGLQVLFRFKGIMNPFRYGSYSIQIISHKLCRWLVPVWLMFLFMLNLFLVDQSTLYGALFLAQVLFYAMALSAIFVKSLRDFPVFKIPFFFVLVNLSILVAWYTYLSGKRFVIWQPTRR